LGIHAELLRLAILVERNDFDSSLVDSELHEPTCVVIGIKVDIHDESRWIPIVGRLSCLDILARIKLGEFRANVGFGFTRRIFELPFNAVTSSPFVDIAFWGKFPDLMEVIARTGYGLPFRPVGLVAWTRSFDVMSQLTAIQELSLVQLLSIEKTTSAQCFVDLPPAEA
jgi:hypothetical protein